MNSVDTALLRPNRGFAILPFSIATLGLIVVAVLFMGYSSLQYLGLVAPASHVERGEASSYEIVVGGITFQVPTGYLRFAEQHRDGVLPGIDLALAWPTMAPLGDAETLRNTPQENIVFIGVSDARDALDTTDLLGSVYSEIFVGPVEHTENGLVRRRLDPQAGYPGETVFFDIGRGTGFAARCAGGGSGTVWETCYRDVILTNGLTVNFRFSPALLADWETLDNTILSFLLMLARAGQGGDVAASE